MFVDYTLLTAIVYGRERTIIIGSEFGQQNILLHTTTHRPTKMLQYVGVYNIMYMCV